jgi:hypothetical protein
MKNLGTKIREQKVQNSRNKNFKNMGTKIQEQNIPKI